MVKSRVEPVYQISSNSESEEQKEASNGGPSSEGSESDSVTLVTSDEEPDMESTSEHEEEEKEGSESDDLYLNLNSLASRSCKFRSKKPTSELDRVSGMPSKPVSLKRAPTDLKENVAKKPKQSRLFQRLWSEEDEIVILNGFIDYVAERNEDPLADLNDFHQFIKKRVHVDASMTQLQRKIRRLRKKFQNNKKKEKDGKDRTFSKPHEREAYGLSKMIWNIEGKLVGSSLKKKKVVEESNAVDGKDRNFVSVLEGKPTNFLATGRGTIEQRIMKIGDELFDVQNAGEGVKQWRSLKAREVELHIAHLDLKKARAKLVLDILKS